MSTFETAMYYYPDAEIETVLRSARVVQPFWVSAIGRFVIFVSFIAVCGLVGYGYQTWLLLPKNVALVGKDLPNGAQLATVLVASVAAIFAYYQWADSRREASLEKFYERLRLTNDRYDRHPAARDLVSHFWDESETKLGFERRMYAFLELDNLEYMLLRYQLGFVRERLIWRAIRTFASRCDSPAFRRLAVLLVSGSGYDLETKAVASELARRADERASAVVAPASRAA